jgi:hypothetical protein
MRHKGVFPFVAAAFAVGAAVAAAPAGAQEILPLDVAPTSGWVGRNVAVAGQGCVNQAGNTGLVSVLLFGEEEQRQFTVEDVLADGSWSTVITLPEGLVPGPHTLTAVCAFAGGGEVDYTVVDFEVIDRTVLDVTPTSGSVGSRVTVSGQGCVNDTGIGTGLVSVLLFGQGDQKQFTVEDVLDDGSWSTVITLPEGLAAGPHLLTAICAFPAGGEVDYTPVDFEVIDATATPPTTTTTVVGPGPQPASPATPVPGEPTFTG